MISFEPIQISKSLKCFICKSKSPSISIVDGNKPGFLSNILLEYFLFLANNNFAS